MRTLHQIKQISFLSDELSEMMRNIKFDEIPNGDIQGMAEAFVMKAYDAGREAGAK